MTDNEIVKALKCCCIEHACSKCPYSKSKSFDCICDIMKDALDLINRQKAEIERLTIDNEIKSQKRANMFEILNAYQRGKAEAIKELRNG